MVGDLPDEVLNYLSGAMRFAMVSKHPVSILIKPIAIGSAARQHRIVFTGRTGSKSILAPMHVPLLADASKNRERFSLLYWQF